MTNPHTKVCSNCESESGFATYHLVDEGRPDTSPTEIYRCVACGIAVVIEELDDMRDVA